MAYLNLTCNWINFWGEGHTIPTTINSGIAYTGPINLAQYNNKTVKIRAMAFRNDMNPSAAAYASYDVLSVGTLPKPIIKCTGALNASSKTVTISLPQQNCTTVPGTAEIIYRQYAYDSNPTIALPFGSMTMGWNNYYSSFTITSSKDLAAVLKAFPSGGYGDVVIKSCCVGSGCLHVLDEESIIK